MTRPRICKRSLYLFWSATRSGTSAQQGPHQVAQKFRRSTLPREPARVTGFPSKPVNLKSGAVSGLRTKRTVGRRSCAASTGEKNRSKQIRKQGSTERER